MRNLRQVTASLLAAAIAILSGAPGLSAIAAEVSSARSAGAGAIPAISALPRTLALPVLGAPLAAPFVPVPSASGVPAAKAAETPLAERILSDLQAPSLIDAAAPAGIDGARGAAADDFERRIGQGAPGAATIAVQALEIERNAAVLSLASRGLGNAWKLSTNSSRDELVDNFPLPAGLSRVPAEAQRRSVYFPLASAAVMGAVTAAVSAVSLLIPSAGAQGWLHAGASALAWTSLAATAALSVAGLAETAVFAYAMARGRGVTDEGFARFLRAETAEGRLEAGLAQQIRPYRPPQDRQDLTFGFAAGGSIYVRPELAAMPWLFRLVVIHEHHHLQALKARGPPTRGFWGRVWGSARAEIAARAAELRGAAFLSRLRVPALERALRQAQLSLQFDEAYDVLVLNPSAADLNDAALYHGLSGGKARLTSVTTEAPQDVLALEAAKYSAIVLDQSARSLAAADPRDQDRLRLALRQLDSLYVLAQRRLRLSDSGFKAGSNDARRYEELAQKAERLGRAPSARSAAQLEQQVRAMWRQVAASRLKGLGVTALTESLYKGLKNKGLAFLSFGPGDQGVEVWERLLRFWEAADGGQFRVTRVDLENSGHILVLRKLESRVGLWLAPIDGKTIKRSVPNAADSTQSRAAARAALVEGGFDKELARFDELGVEVSQVFGGDSPRQLIYVTIPRRNASQIRKFVTSSGMRHEPSRNDFRPHLNDAGGIHRVAAVWNSGITGSDETILFNDTGADASHEDFGGRLEVIDSVHDGPEDWVGHGTVVAAIALSGGRIFTGMARAARGFMNKVFGRDNPGATDALIMAGGVLGLQKAVAGISNSLGVGGNSGSSLSVVYSDLTHKANSKGEYITAVGSAGNSGPADRSGSQPAAGADVLSVAAAAKSLDDGIPEIAFFSSAGPDVDPRFAFKRWRLFPKITAIGGDVVTEPGEPNVYKRGVVSAKSKDMPAAPADLPDKRHTAMSGTSMSAPMAAGIALLVRSALRMTGVKDSPATARLIMQAAPDLWTAVKMAVTVIGLTKTGHLPPEDVPLAVRAILMRTATDMGVPVWFQGAGLIDAWEAVKLALGIGGDRADLYGWIARYKAVLDLEDQVYKATELAKSEAQARFDDTERGDTIKDELGALGEDLASADAGTRLTAVRALVKLRLADKALAGWRLEWLRQAQEDSEPRVRRAAQKAFVVRGLADDLKGDALTESKSARGDLIAAEARKQFDSERDKALPALKAMLKDPVWLIRLQAAMTLLNLKSPEAAMELAEAALHDEDARVRQMAFLALAETPTHAIDVLLQKASQDARWDVAGYAAYALARHGDTSGVVRLIAETASSDKRTRYTATWLLGQLGARATAREAETLSSTVAQLSERGNIRHLAAAALTNIASAAPEALSDKVVLDLLAASGTDNLALTRTVAKFFPAAAVDKAFAARLKQEPLKAAVTRFVLKNKGSVTLPGALGEMVKLLARLADVPLNDPTPAPDPSGQGVKGVDPLLGPLELLVELPEGRALAEYWDETRGDPAVALAAAGLDAELLSRLQAQLRAALPLERAFWISVPEHKLYAFRLAMERLGLSTRMPAPRYSAAKRSVEAAGQGAILDLSDGGTPALPVGADLSLVRIRAGAGASEARVIAALEAVAAAAEPLKKPVIVALDAIAPASAASAKRRSRLASLAGLLALHNIGVVAPAGNEGPWPGSVAAPAAAFAVVVAAATAAGLQDYSARGRNGETPIAWAEVVDDLSTAAGNQGTGEAAERSALKLAALSERMAQAFAAAARPLPVGWFLLIRSVVERSLSPMPAHGAHEVGGGLFENPAKAAELLDRRLADLDAAAGEARALMASARRSESAREIVAASEAALRAAGKSVAEESVLGMIAEAAARWLQ